jgi:hypothetical protein
MKRSLIDTENLAYVADGRRCREKSSGTARIVQKEMEEASEFDRQGALARFLVRRLKVWIAQAAG